MELMDREAASVDVGMQLRRLREERKISMRELARLSGLSANALSMIERGLTSPSVSTLNKLAGALEVPITAFFRIESQRQPVVYCRASQRSRLPFLRGLWEGLGSENFAGRMEAFALTLETGGSSGSFGIVHGGHEFVFCLRGTVEYEVGQDVYTLSAGDTLIFAAQMTHRWRNNGPNVATLIIVISGYDETERPVEFHTVTLQGKPGEEDAE
ncbi:helix-turn-helix domain-containing protein [Levilinea saccharolytica]|uniref:helix-turn-helix domain-containing protein n=1 Tax=Levilinea saccharolytica TaxID=229921 RepID=UPI0007857704|nr:helix-turn-helix domain-containing protein [Levilinea saccharolytica]GAP17837.1 transcriptional regulator, XRE family with cupin sensor [Levilinea saccharolytica]